MAETSIQPQTHAHLLKTELTTEMDTDVEYLEYLWPMRHYLISCGDLHAGTANIIAISFCMPVSKTPPLIACAIGHNAYSLELIERTHEFVVNVPPRELEPKVYFCGFHSGHDLDKFKASGLTPLPARRLTAPIIAECVAWMECTVQQEITTGDKNIFVGEVVEAYADEALVKGKRKIEYAQGAFPRTIYGTRFGE